MTRLQELQTIRQATIDSAQQHAVSLSIVNIKHKLADLTNQLRCKFFQEKGRSYTSAARVGKVRQLVDASGLEHVSERGILESARAFVADLYGDPTRQSLPQSVSQRFAAADVDAV